MIEWQPMDTLTEEEEHGEILVKGYDHHFVFHWTGKHWTNTRLSYPDSILHNSHWLREHCLSWVRLR